jgi:hypothetical protein
MDTMLGARINPFLYKTLKSADELKIVTTITSENTVLVVLLLAVSEVQEISTFHLEIIYVADSCALRAV